MNKEKHVGHLIINLIGRFFVIIGTESYLIIKNVTEGLTKKIRFSISFKIALVYVRWLVASLFLSMLLINGALCATTINTMWQELNTIGDEFVDNYQKFGDEAALKMNNIILYKQFTAYVLNDKYEEVLSLGSSEPGYFKSENSNPKYPYFSNINDEYYFVYREKFDLDEQQYQIIIYNDVSEKLIFLVRFFLFTMVASGFVILVTVLFGFKSNSRVLKPIRDITETTKKISGSNLSLRINVKGVQDEFKELAQTINDMMDRIETSYNKQRQFVSDASHELRTPISVLQGYANLLDRWGKDDPAVLQESISAIRNESENMKELVEKLLFLARNDRNTLSIQKEPFDLSDLLLELVKETEIIDNKHQILCDIEDGIIFNGDRNGIKQALRIFIDNAVKYTPENGKIFVKADLNKEKIEISVKDTGNGIPKEDIQYVFDRFYRSDKSRTKEKGGHGLGLAIAKIIILGHKGKIKVRSKVGEGSEFQITFFQ